jgi:hypothetical protein
MTTGLMYMIINLIFFIHIAWLRALQKIAASATAKEKIFMRLL